MAVSSLHLEDERVPTIQSEDAEHATQSSFWLCPASFFETLYSHIEKSVDKSLLKLINELKDLHGKNGAGILMELQQLRCFPIIFDYTGFQQIVQLYKTKILQSGVLKIPTTLRNWDSNCLINNYRANIDTEIDTLQNSDTLEARRQQLKDRKELLQSLQKTKEATLSQIKENKKRIATLSEEFVLKSDLLNHYQTLDENSELLPYLFPEATRGEHLDITFDFSEALQKKLSELKENCQLLRRYASTFKKMACDSEGVDVEAIERNSVTGTTPDRQKSVIIHSPTQALSNLNTRASVNTDENSSVFFNDGKSIDEIPFGSSEDESVSALLPDTDETLDRNFIDMCLSNI